MISAVVRSYRYTFHRLKGGWVRERLSNAGIVVRQTESAVLEMARHGIRQLPVVHHDDARRLAGILAMSDVSAYLERQRSVVER